MSDKMLICKQCGGVGIVRKKDSICLGCLIETLETRLTKLEKQ